MSRARRSVVGRNNDQSPPRWRALGTAATERYLPGRAPGAPLVELPLTEHTTTPSYPPYSLTRKVWDNGVISYQRLAVNVGRR